jgi:hypothetical protein
MTLTDAQMATIWLQHPFHDDWNYTIHPMSERRRPSGVF